jgi:hypothetical protein
MSKHFSSALRPILAALPGTSALLAPSAVGQTVVPANSASQAADDSRNHPALKNKDISRTASFGKVGMLATNKAGTKRAWLVAYDKRDGNIVGQVRMNKRVTGSPTTCAIDRKQYTAISITSPGERVVYALPT